MSILKNTEKGWLISHENLIKDIYYDLGFEFKPELFEIILPFKKGKPKQFNPQNSDERFELEVKFVEKLFNSFLQSIVYDNNYHCLFKKLSNEDALKAADLAYSQSGNNQISNVFGSNTCSVIRELQNNVYLFPRNCKFFCKDTCDLSKYLKEKYDLILLDPPWWNKYIRRKRKKSNHAYNMMYNDDLKLLPLENYIKNSGIIIVWCTNSSHHLNKLINDIFPKWGVHFIGKWYWVKITKSYETVCNFNKPPAKQPFEQIIFGVKKDRNVENPTMNKVVVSVPSAIHSHKPPLIELLKPYLPENPDCLEIFARYLLPEWTSYGQEALRFQNTCLFKKV